MGLKGQVYLLLYADGRVYEGKWKNDKQYEKDKYSWPGGDFYEGEWKDGKQHGKGESVRRKRQLTYWIKARFQYLVNIYRELPIGFEQD